MKLISTMTPATPWLASPLGSAMTGIASVVHAARVTARVTAPSLGLLADGAVKLRQEKCARVQAAGAASFAYGTTVMIADHPAVSGRPAGDEQTTRTANGGVQGPPPWRRPVIT